MKKVILIALLAIASVSAIAPASACPKGTHPHGGTGSHHAGGQCY